MGHYGLRIQTKTCNFSVPTLASTGNLYRPFSRIRHISHSSTVHSEARHAVVTGASRGIGLAIAKSLAKTGYDLTLISRSATALEKAASSLPPSSSQPRLIPGDVSSRTFWDSLDGSLTNDKGVKSRIDVLVNAAGISHQSLFLRTTESCIEDVVQTNLMGTMWACRKIGRQMLRQKSEDGQGKGVIINVSSLLAVQDGMGSAAYVASKAGIVGFSRALSAELGSGGIRVNTILPGYVETDMTEAMSAEARDQALKRIPLKRFATTDEIADAVMFLIQNAYAHNCVLNLDGGLSATVRQATIVTATPADSLQ